MKKLFILLIATGLVVAADAQPGHRNGRRGNVGVSVNVGIGGPQSGYFAADRRLREEIAAINFKYDRRVQQVRNSFFMRPAVKARQIRSLEIQRKREIRRVQLKYGRYNHGPRRY
jgi:hypothetical protein